MKKNQEYFIQVQLGSGGQLYGTKEFNELIEDQKTVIETKLQHMTDIMTFLSELKETIETGGISMRAPFLPVSARLSHIYQEISAVGFDRVRSMNETMDEIVFGTRDSQGRDHLLTVTLPAHYPFAPPHIVAYLPITLERQLPMTKVIKQHEDAVNIYQAFFDCMDGLDHHLKVVEPDHPTRSDVWRKFALGHHCSMHLEIADPLAPWEKPIIRLFGSEKRVEDLRRAWDHATWNKEIGLYQNLLNIFQLVSNKHSEKEDYTNTADIECGICYSYKLDNGETPETACKLCHRGFHSTCLFHVSTRY
ncbi:WD-repeat region-domain-containing protein [Sporodiniella umbellata]|nr:WD-repeat region-domain-containing protein [Sporodiniella umbellata]